MKCSCFYEIQIKLIITLGIHCYFIMAQNNAFVSFTYLQHLLAIVKVGMLDTDAEVLCFDHQSGETKVYKIYICLFSSKHSWSVWTSDEVGSESMCMCGVICIQSCGLLFVRARTVGSESMCMCRVICIQSCGLLFVRARTVG